MHGRRHEYTPIARVVLASTLTDTDVPLCADTSTTAIAAVIPLVPSTQAAL